MQKSTSLADTAMQFTQWRKLRLSNQSRTPKHLKQQAVQLLTEYPISMVVSALKTNHASLERWRAELESSLEDSEKPDTDFIELTEPEPIEVSKGMSLTINYPSGVTLKLEGRPENSTLHMLLASLEMARGVA